MNTARSTRLIIATGAASAGAAVLLGAFAAHGLRTVLEPRMLEVFDTGVRYQMYHALALLLTGMLQLRSGTPFTPAAVLFLAGTVLFSGSLYALALTGIGALGMITPLGGLAFVAGWGMLAWRALRHQNHDHLS